MKLRSALLGAALILAIPILGSANVLTWNFLNDLPTHSPGIKVGDPWSFANLQGNQTTITASGSERFLYEKNQSGHTGLGLFDPPENEISGNGWITLDLSKILAFNPGAIDITLSSLGFSDSGYISYGNSHGFFVTNSSPSTLNLDYLRASQGLLKVSAAQCDDVLINQVSTITPEPASVGLFGLAGLAATLFGLKRRKATKS
jgi:hypothetical protein